MNLCDSGVASCYHYGRSTGEAAGLIRRYRPSVVTLNEVCRRDVLGAGAPIPVAVDGVAHASGDTAFALFSPAVNLVTGMPYRCTDGDLYGIGIVGVGSVATTRHYLYRDQYARTDEGRVVLCAEVGGDDVCTTHLESDDHATAVDQCHELAGDVGDFRRTGLPTVVGGDFNLVDVGGCLPGGWVTGGDGIVQHVMAVRLRIVDTFAVHMRYTDHPALVVDLTS